MVSPSLEPRVRELLATGEVRGAATEAIRVLGPEVLNFLRSLLRNEDMAAEAFSRFSEHLWKGIPAYRASASLRTWAFRIATHVALDLRRDPWRRRGRRLATHEASRIADEVRTRTPVRVERQRRALDVLREALSVEERALLSLRVDRELSWSEIADVLSAEGRPVGVEALAKRYERLKERLATAARDLGLL